MKKNYTRSGIAAILALGLTFALVVSSLASGVYATPTFPDVKKSDWYYTYVEQAAEKGWVSGYEDGTFRPKNPVTYAQFSVMLTQGFFRDKVASYVNNGGPWYLSYTGPANELHMFDGTALEGNNGYANGDLVGLQLNRYEMAQMRYNTLRAAGVATSADLNKAAVETEDWSSIPIKYREAVATVKAAGLITGTNEAGRFSGELNMNRAQAAVVMIATDKAVNTAKDEGNAGQLKNGKEATPENVLAMMAEIEKDYPNGTVWGDSSTPNTKKNPNPVSYTVENILKNKHMTSPIGGCGGFAAMVSDLIFPANLACREVTDMSQVRPGDIIVEMDKKGVLLLRAKIGKRRMKEETGNGRGMML